jgi:hypothetical protein
VSKPSPFAVIVNHPLITIVSFDFHSNDLSLDLDFNKMYVVQGLYINTIELHTSYLKC